jgi:hypothetical protein
LEGNPAVVIIGNGQSGVLRVDSETKKAIEAKARLLVLRTPEAIEKFNELSKEKRVNALVHTTC